MRLEFSGQSARDSNNIQANTSRLVNCYREPVQGGGKTQHVIKSVPGTSAFSSISGVFVRAMEEIGGAVYALCGGSMHKVMPDGSALALGAVIDSEDATVSGNNGNVTVVTGGRYYVWNGTTLVEPATGAFNAFGSVDYVSNYTVLTERDGTKFQWSAVANPASLPGLNFSSADGKDDKIIRGMAIGGAYIVFKAKSQEVWYVTGESGANAFTRQAGGVTDVGLKAFGLVCKIPGGGAFYVSDDGKARVIGLPQPVSTAAVETAIAEGKPEKCIATEDEGHTFCAIVFRDRPAWIYDMSTGEWHERAQGADLGPWRASASVKAWGKWFIGRSGGAVLELGRTNTDGGIVLPRVMVSRTMAMEDRRFVVTELACFPRTGFGAGTIELRVSRDNGHTWGAPKPRSWGIGDFGKRMAWRALGQFRQMTVELRMTDAIECPINAEGVVNVSG